MTLLASDPLFSGPAPKFGARRTDPLVRLVEATEFSADEDLCDPVDIVRFVKGQPQLLEAIHDAFGHGDEHGDEAEGRAEGRPRLEGSWPLAFLAFTLSSTASVQKWRSSVRSFDGLWRACGFEHIPSYPTVERRFIELEQRNPNGFAEATRMVIAHARSHEPAIGRGVTVDGTLTSTRASLVHRCPATTVCGAKQQENARWRQSNGRARRACKTLGYGSRTAPLSVEESNRLKHAEVRDSDPDGPKPASISRIKALKPSEVSALGLDAGFRWWKQTFKNDDVHYYCCQDLTVGARNYAKTGGGNQFSIGWNRMRASDVLTGICLGVEIFPSDQQEYDRYPDLMKQVQRNVGRSPHLVTGDRGLSVMSVFALNSCNGTGSVLPFRKTAGFTKPEQMENERVDRHGHPRCQHCGAPCKTAGSGLGFVVTTFGTPTIRGRCMAKVESGCRSIQSFACSTGPRLLQPLTKDANVYAQGEFLHDNSERVHIHDRQRYTLSGRDTMLRSYRLGMHWQLLRMSAAQFLDAFRLGLRHGWFCSLRAASRAPAYAIIDDSGRAARATREREQHQLDLPYGPAAYRLGIGWLDPPWRSHPDGAGIARSPISPLIP